MEVTNPRAGPGVASRAGRAPGLGAAVEQRELRAHGALAQREARGRLARRQAQARARPQALARLPRARALEVLHHLPDLQRARRARQALLHVQAVRARQRRHVLRAVRVHAGAALAGPRARAPRPARRAAARRQDVVLAQLRRARLRLRLRLHVAPPAQERRRVFVQTAERARRSRQRGVVEWRAARRPSV